MYILSIRGQMMKSLKKLKKGNNKLKQKTTIDYRVDTNGVKGKYEIISLLITPHKTRTQKENESIVFNIMGCISKHSKTFLSHWEIDDNIYILTLKGGK